MQNLVTHNILTLHEVVSKQLEMFHLIGYVHDIISVCGIDNVLVVGGKDAASVERPNHRDQHRKQPVPL